MPSLPEHAVVETPHPGRFLLVARGVRAMQLLIAVDAERGQRLREHGCERRAQAELLMISADAAAIDDLVQRARSLGHVVADER